jgi:3-hexulose-6-phosphate synthase
MKLQIRYNLVDQKEALEIAQRTAQFADIIEIGALLLFHYGIEIIKKFKELAPSKPIYVDSKIAARPEDSVNLFTKAGAHYISVLAGVHNNIIQKACTAARQSEVNIVLDCIDDPQIGQSAADAKALGVSSLLIHRNIFNKEEDSIEREWDQVRGNTDLPIFIKGNISKAILPKIISLKPKGIVVGSAITHTDNPEQEAEEIKKLMSK